MFKLFTNPNLKKLSPFETFPMWNSNICPYIKQNISNICNYLRSTEEQVKNTNVLVTLLNIATPLISMEDTRYLNTVLNTVKYKANYLGIGIGNNKPTIMKDVFNKNSYEIIIADDSTEDYFLNLKNKIDWKDFISLKPIYHNYSTFDYEIRECKRDLDGGLIIYYLDIVLLLMSYKRWIENRMKYGRSTKPHIFISQIVLPNSLKIDINYVIFNRLKKINNGEKTIYSTLKNYPIYLRSLDLLIDKLLDKVSSESLNRTLQYERLIKTIPSVDYNNYSNMLDILSIDNVYYTKQMKWVIWLARIPIIKDILALSNVSSLLLNKDYINSLKTDFEDYVSRGVEIKPNAVGYRNYNNFIADLTFIKDVVLPNVNIKIK